MVLNKDASRNRQPVRVISASSLFDFNEEAIDLFRRLLQDTGAEVIHLGLRRSAEEIVDAAIDEDVQAIAVSCFRKGCVDFFKHLQDLLSKRNADRIKTLGLCDAGEDEIKALESCGISGIHPYTGASLKDLQDFISRVFEKTEFLYAETRYVPDKLSAENTGYVARLISMAEAAAGGEDNQFKDAGFEILDISSGSSAPVVGITGTGGAGKSTLTDELLFRLLVNHPDLKIGVLCCDPVRSKSGGALLGDRMRINAAQNPRVYMRSLAVRSANAELPDVLPDAVNILKAAGFDLIIAETAGIGQGASNIFDLTDVSTYVMTCDYGAGTQLEKIDMLDFADIVVVNKYEREGSEDAVRDIKKQVQRNRKAWTTPPGQMPVFGTIASKFNDDGVTFFYRYLLKTIADKTGAGLAESAPEAEAGAASSSKTIFVPHERCRYLSEISDAVRKYHSHTRSQAEAVRKAWHIRETKERIDQSGAAGIDREKLNGLFASEADAAQERIEKETREKIEAWNKIRSRYSADELSFKKGGRQIRESLFSESPSGNRIPAVSLPCFTDPGDIYSWMRRENLPGEFPYTAGAYPLRREDENIIRVCAGPGGPAAANKTMRRLSAGFDATRLAAEFDRPTLFGYDPAEVPEIYCRIGEKGVSVCTIEDVKTLFKGFDLSDPASSVGMDISGPASIILAMFLNTAVDQQMERFSEENGRNPNPEEASGIRQQVLGNIRGTVQSDSLGQEQVRGECIFPTDFCLRVTADTMQYFIDNSMQNFHCLSVSGRPFAEAGANPVSQLAFTLANGFTYVEYCLARGIPLNTILRSISFAFSSGMDPEHSVIGRTARRIWAVAMRDIYGGDEDLCALKYHVQASEQPADSLEDVRTALKSLYAVHDNCNSLLSLSYDKDSGSLTEDSMRRALAIQELVEKEFGMAKSQNINQGSFAVEALTCLLEEAVLSEFDHITDRGGVRGAMERRYQQRRIREDADRLKEFRRSKEPAAEQSPLPGQTPDGEAGESERRHILEQREAFVEKNRDQAPEALQKLKDTVFSGENVFAELMNTVRYCTLGQITQALYDSGCRHRRRM